MTCCIPPRGPEFCRCKDTCSPPKLWKFTLQALRHVNDGCGATPLELVCYIKGKHNVPLNEDCLKQIVKMVLKKAICLGFLKRNSSGKYYAPVGPDAREPTPSPKRCACSNCQNCSSSPPIRKCCPPPKPKCCAPPQPKCPRVQKTKCCGYCASSPSPCQQPKHKCCAYCASSPPPCPQPKKRCPKVKPEPRCPKTKKRTQKCDNCAESSTSSY